jgi:hypothetical protein
MAAHGPEIRPRRAPDLSSIPHPRRYERAAMSLLLDARRIELFAILLALAIAFAAPTALRPAYRRLRRALDWLADRPARSIWIAACVAGLGSAAVALFVQWPVPRVHDEFSYLMAADTFAHGRLSNPTPPMWRHFETFHVFFTPVYASKYPPGQGLVLAVGQLVFGSPVVSLWISAAVLCGALAWMFQAWLSPRFAALASMLAVLQFGIGNYWTQSYWGGALAATGGALAFGALPRWIRRPRVRDALILGLGLAVLANTRPFEGLVAAAPIAVVLGVRCIRWLRRRELVPLATATLPIGVVLGCCAVWIAYYNRSITGFASLMPYWIHDRIYTIAPPFLWMSLAAEPHYNHAVIREYWTGFGLDEYTRQMDVARLGETLRTKVVVFWRFYVGVLWTAPCIAVVLALRTPWIRLAAATSIWFFVVLLGETYTLAHYAAPIAGILFVLIAAGLRRMSVVRVRRRPVGRAAVVCLCIASVGSLAGQIVLRKRPHDAWDQVRARVLSELTATAEPDLVIVRYGSKHDPDDEWVFNTADIEASPVVWARDMSRDENRELVDSFRGRRVWLLEVDMDEAVPALVPYSL